MMRGIVGLLLLLLLLFGVACWAMLLAFGMPEGDATFYACAATLSACVMCWGVSFVVPPFPRRRRT